MRQQFFSGASENDNVSGFRLRIDGWKDLMRKKQAHIAHIIEASRDENFPTLLLGKIPKYSIIFEPEKFIE